MSVRKIDENYVMELAEEVSKNNTVTYDELPQYDLFLSQVIDYLNDKFSDEKYTNNIVQNYIKSEVISKPEDGKKRGYTKLHLAQLVLLSYMRPVLTTEEIKKVFSLVFNDINNREDDIISWEEAYEIFSDVQEHSYQEIFASHIFNEEKVNKTISKLNLGEEDNEKIKLFVLVMSLVFQASIIKKMVSKIVNENSED
ncbi:DUF1836 domain-containing protein [Clostridium massiliamazoniense]|uniref:DUF1836 domain-containing protein n=1 Tax=Clostridium massiliamazoniense TaxID=1347366 RepID=UPI0006D7970E|nr:DUF1836 domain-containing protein [Clostridium massiliamazoniense]